MNFHFRSFLFFSIFFGSYTIAFAQTTFSKVYGGNGYDKGYSVTQTFDNGYAITGMTSSFGNGISDAFILKTDSIGLVKWYRTFGGANIEEAWSIKETSDSGLVIAGYTNSFGYGGYDLFVVRTDRNGNAIWQKNYGGINWDLAYSIDQTFDGGFIIAGGTYSFGSGDEDMYLLKINSAGDTLWSRTYGGAFEDEIRSVKQTPDSGFILTGSTKSFGDQNGDIYCIKTNSQGVPSWTYKYDGGMEDGSNEVIENIYGGYIIGGKSKLYTGNNFNGIEIEISSLGIQTAIDTVFGGTAADDFISSIKQSPGGRLAEAGTSFSWGWGAGDFMLHIWNPITGWHLPTMGWYGAEIGYSLGKTRDGGYIFCGSSASYSFLDNIFLVKTDSNGLAPLTVTATLLSGYKTEVDNDLFNIYPIPASNEIFIDELTAMEDQATISIKDVLGRELFKRTYTFNDSHLEINTNDIPNGIYFVSIQNQKFTSTKRIIIGH